MAGAGVGAVGGVQRIPDRLDLFVVDCRVVVLVRQHQLHGVEVPSRSGDGDKAVHRQTGRPGGVRLALEQGGGVGLSSNLRTSCAGGV